MKEQDKQAPTVHNTFNAPIGQYVQYQHIEHMTIGSDGQIHVAASSQPIPQHAPQPSAATIDPSTLIFKPNEQNKTAVEELLKSTLTISTKKSVICRKLYEQRALYNLHAHDDTTKATIINAWLNKFGITIKAPFTRHDFGENYCK
jgi:hypothetical protein